MRNQNVSPGLALTSLQSDTIDFSVRAPKQLDRANPTVTVIIGPNGSGKSYALAEVAREFQDLQALINPPDSEYRSKSRVNGAYESVVKYNMSGQECIVIRRGESISATINGSQVNPKDMPFPKRLICSAHLISDRFTFSQNSENDFYRYLGLRQSGNMTTVGALESKVLNAYIRGSFSGDMDHMLLPWYELLGIRGDLHVLMRIRRGLLQEDAIGRREMIQDSLRKQQKGMRAREISTSKVDLVTKFIDGLLDIMEPVDKRWHGAPLTQFRGRSGMDSSDLISALDLARQYHLIDQPSLAFVEGDPHRILRFDDLSSGERQILGTVCRIVEAVIPDSIVLIDEPEVSLHPEWQKRFIPLLLETLHATSCHLLIATHSHFVVADVKDDDMSLLISSGGPRRRWDISHQSPLHLEEFDEPVYGRSPENILYRAFGVGSAGNLAVEKDLVDALQMTSGRQRADTGRMEDIIVRLSRVAQPDNPAITVIVERLRAQLVEHD